jgi:hypothetical protein
MVENTDRMLVEVYVLRYQTVMNCELEIGPSGVLNEIMMVIFTELEFW